METDGRVILKRAAKDPEVKIRTNGKHPNICKNGQSMPCPNRELGKGLACKIVKWCIKMGITLAIIYFIFILLEYQMKLLAG